MELNEIAYTKRILLIDLKSSSGKVDFGKINSFQNKIKL
jgi:hypothetical protein